MLAGIQDRELRFGELLAGGIAVFQRHAGTIATIALAINLPLNVAFLLLPEMVLNVLVGQDTLRWFKQLVTGEIGIQRFFELSGGGSLVAVLSIVGMVLLFGLLGVLPIAAVCLLVERSLLGESLDWVQVLQRSRSRAIGTFWTSVLFGLQVFVAIAVGFTLGGMLAFSLFVIHLRQRGGLDAEIDNLGGILLLGVGTVLLLTLPLLISAIVSYGFSLCIATLERTCGWSALKASKRLVAKCRWRVFLYSAGIFLIPATVSALCLIWFPPSPETVFLSAIAGTIQSFVFYLGVTLYTVFFKNLNYLAAPSQSW